ncbi:unnamed protein product [Rhizophagus irregularis]|nr:unnamed protein product [Rhizophagus irregularis]CAB4418506.1 unnamed protein product [Rhizophagus irregularis]CAB4446919.1 unnamed protein product [Rhizophagus irregularis]
MANVLNVNMFNVLTNWPNDANYSFNKVDLMYSQPQYIATCLCKNMKYEGIIDEDRGEMLLYIVLGMPNEVNINKKVTIVHKSLKY